jgi:hypothetical protein
MHALWILLAASMAVSSAAPAAAQPRDPAAAEALFRQGRDAMKRQDYATACPKFAESQRFDPAAGTLLNLAQCEQKLGKLASAWQHYQEAADQLPAGDPRVTIARQGVAELDKKVPRLVVRLEAGAPEGTKVRRDGVELGGASLGTPLPVDPGDHVVVVVAPGRSEARFTVALGAAETKTVDAEAGPESVAAATTGASQGPGERQPAPARPDKADARGANGDAFRTVGWVTAGAGVVGLGVGTYFAFSARSNDSRALEKDEQGNPKWCDANQCWAEPGATYSQDARSDSKRAAVALVTGGVLLAAGVVLVLAAPSGGGAKGTLVSLRARATADGIGAVVGGAW